MSFGAKRAFKLLQANPEVLPDPVALLDPIRDPEGRITDFVISWVSKSVMGSLGAPPADWIGRRLSTVVDDEYQPTVAEMVIETDGGSTSVRRMLLRDAHDVPRWAEVHAKAFFDGKDRPDGRVVSWRMIDHEVAAEQAIEQARLKQAQADDRFRRLMESSNVGMCLTAPDGRFDVVNQALCDFYGYDAETLVTKTWQELTPSRYLEADLQWAADMVAGQLDRYRVTKQYIHAGGHLVWADLSVSCLRDAAGELEYFVAQIVDVTKEVESRQLLAERERENRAMADRLAADLVSAASYVASILPGDLEGPVRVSSRYLPSEKLGGDSFDYRWVDEDHLIAYLIDVSGHGVESALLTVSVHNVLRSGSLPPETQLQPDRVLAELNRLFGMEVQGGNYFTAWYGVYRRSTRTLRYASAGHPPALGLSPDGDGVAVTPLATPTLPVGMFADTEFSTAEYRPPAGSQILIYSDGAYERAIDDGTSQKDFVELCAELATRTGWSLDVLVERIQAELEDDCSLVLLTFE